MGSFDAGWVLGAAVYLAPLAGGLTLYFRRRRATERAHLRALERAEARGLHEPVSLHPVINRNRCMGCGACVEACPQGDVLGVIGGQAELVNPTHCIGHGACQRACPFDAITLVIGSETRGVEIPVLDASFQTDVPGIFVAGELAGMGLIRNAIEQGRRAVEAIRKLDGIGRGDRLDVVIVGAGPAGFAASLAATQHGLRYVTLEQDTLGGSLVHHPRGKIVVTHPVDVPMVGKVDLRATSKESLLAFWERTRRETRLRVRERERVEAIERLPGDAGFEVRSTGGRYGARAVLLAVGRRGTPRRLGVPGEDRSKVVYRLADPEQYRDRRVLVVGGGDSALEAAAALGRVRGTQVTLSYRGEGFFRAGPESEAGLDAARRAGRVEVILGSQVREIGEDAVRLATPSGERRLGNDAVIVCAGGVMPSDFLRAAGVRTRTQYGTPLPS